MPVYTTPGVYVIEKDLSDVVAPLGTSTGVIVGATYTGPVYSRRLVTNNKEFIQTFGTPISGTDSEFDMYGALRFLSQSNSLYFTRVPNVGSDKYSSLCLTPGTGSTSANIISTTTSGIPTIALNINSYPSGYTQSTRGGNPGIGDIEDTDTSAYTTATTPLVIAAQGPGIYGNDIAISIITSAHEGVSAGTSAISASLSTLNQTGYGFDWKYQFDDTANINAADATWKKVIRVNVYTKKSTASWPTSANYATTKPDESFLCSLDQTAKNAVGSSLFIGDIINGNSAYIYVKVNGLVSTVLNAATDLTSVGADYIKIMPLTSGVNSIANTNTSAFTNVVDYLYSNKNDVTFSMLIATRGTDGSAGYASYVNKLNTIAATRQDAVAITQIGLSTTKTRDAVIAIDNSGSLTYLNPSYTAKYTGFDQVYDSYTDKVLLLPKAPYAAALIARTDRIANVWNAPAGYARGVVADAVGQNVVLNDADIGILYSQNSINCSKKVPGLGHVIWGHRTAQLKQSALRDIEVRRTLIFIETSISLALNSFLFEPNTDKTRTRVYGIVNDFLKGIKNAEGINDYSAVCDSSNNTAAVIDNNQLNVDIYIKPTRTIDFIQLQTIVTRSGVSFTEVM